MFKLAPPKVIALMVAGMLACSPSANATLIGDTITVTQTGGFSNESTMVVVGAGAELIGAVDSGIAFGDLLPGEFIDIGAESISGHWEGIAFAPGLSIVFSDLDWIGVAGEITGIANFMSEDPEFAAGAISFTADSITIDLSELVATGDWSFDIVVDHAVEPGQTEIPEPSALAILSLGLAGLGAVRRRKSR